ncbi:MAG: non-canonical purine NTP pyrophosphatase, RdgB/HAM1 family [Chlamydiae bacterium RIFCSPHIGHO2_12_FULL_49_11]|nr:MAG: non-canonical purine NTP pyrophosphatase, RdgB/HAM1 family [Chlamydiae bacterium RIFCSPHIGHO2_12_FULL_49_11]
MEIVVATSNMHKFRELKSMLKGLFHGMEIDIYSLHHFPEYTLPEETGSSFEENATLKALHAVRHLNRPVIADDSGLCIPALGGAPGILSARYAGVEATDQDNRTKLKAALENLREEERVGEFVSALAFALPDRGLIKTTVGYAEGKLLTKEQGGGGFGYDPLFLKYDYRKTYAELDDEIKNRISHRRKAFDKLSSALLQYFEKLCVT